MRDPNKSTRFVFYCYEKESADLKIRLRYDGLRQSEFFRTLLLRYINKDPTMLQIVEDIKKESRIMGKQKLKRTKEDLARGNKILEDLGITDSDKQDIFDMIEMDLEEYE
jgi:hypothetical protein